MKYTLLWLFNLLVLSALSQPVSPIVIQTKNTSLVFTLGKNHRVYQSYLGARLANTEYSTLSGGQEAYLTAGMENLFEPAIRLVHADGNPSLELTYASHTANQQGNVTTT